MIRLESAICAAALAVGCSCALDHTLPVDAAQEDGGPGTECSSSPDVTGIIVPVGDCARPAVDCQLYARGLSPGPTAVATCFERTGIGGCSSGDRCDGPLCTCGTVACRGDEICVRDPAGSLRCVAQCLRERTPPRACAPVSERVPTVATLRACDEAAAHECRLWAQSMAPPGTRALATCGGLYGSGVYCGFGDACTANVFDRLDCTCGGVTCGPTELCVANEVGDMSPHCVEACWASS